MTTTHNRSAGIAGSLAGQRAITFSGSRLDRADHLRSDPVALAALAGTGGRLLRLDGIDARVDAQGRLEWTGLDGAEAGELILLGIDEAGHGCFAAVPDAARAGVAPASPRLWQVMAEMPDPEIAIYGLARSLAGWHARHKFCPRCGSGTTIARGGWQRNCVNDACRAEHFPRTDPVVIMLVEHDGQVLLGRQPRFPPTRYSALAGFVEPGETIEEAVAREVFEEAGVVATRVTYVCSQPWPFPSSLMIACHAETDDPAITIDTLELDDARWFTRAQISAAMAGASDAVFGAPPPHAVAWHLLDWWLGRG
jgi:NAD+ diphosphatase